MISRTRILSLFIVGLFVLIIVKLFYVQVIHKSVYQTRGDGQYMTGRGETEPRGSIYFTRQDGNLVSAATMNSGYILAISPRTIINPEETFKKINTIYPIEKNIFNEKMLKKTDPYEEIAHRVPKNKKEELFNAKIEGVILTRELWRSYPAGKQASHVLGVVAHVGDYEQGVYGLEKFYEKYLTPPDTQANINSFAAVFRNIKKGKNTRMDIVTTLEPEIQVALEKTVEDVQKLYSSEGVGGIVMDPKTGEILAMTYTPGFDPNDLKSAKDESVFLNPAVSKVYEFGSVMKPLIVATGIDLGVVDENTKFNDTGSIKVGVETIHNFDKKGRGVVTIKTILGQSLNTGMVMIFQKIGISDMRKYLTSYGFREKTNIDLPSEINSLTKNWDSNRDIEFASASFGQGFAVTPIQAIRAFSTLANGGIPANPHIVKEIRTPDGEVVKKFENTYLDRALKEETAKRISSVLTKVVDTDLQNGTLAFPHHSVAAKTGTAQIAGPNGKYYDDRYLHTMFAYIPASNPKYIVLLYNVYPKNVEYASYSLAKPLFSYLRFLISYGRIEPDR